MGIRPTYDPRDTLNQQQQTYTVSSQHIIQTFYTACSESDDLAKTGDILPYTTKTADGTKRRESLFFSTYTSEIRRPLSLAIIRPLRGGQNSWFVREGG